MKKRLACVLFLAVALMMPGLVCANSTKEQGTTDSTPPVPAPEKCEQKLPPIGLYSAANNLLDAAYYAQWVLEDIVCKYPDNEEAKRALAKLTRAIEKAEGR